MRAGRVSPPRPRRVELPRRAARLELRHCHAPAPRSTAKMLPPCRRPAGSSATTTTSDAGRARDALFYREPPRRRALLPRPALLPRRSSTRLRLAPHTCVPVAAGAAAWPSAVRCADAAASPPSAAPCAAAPTAPSVHPPRARARARHSPPPAVAAAVGGSAPGEPAERADTRPHGTLFAAAAAAPPQAPSTPSPAAAATGEGEPCPAPEPCPVLPVLLSARQALADAVTRAAAAALLTCRAHRRAAEHSAQHAVRQAALRLLR